MKEYKYLPQETTLASFLDTVFHGSDAYWIGTARQAASSTLSQVERIRRPQGWYMNIATYQTDDSDGKRYRQQKFYDQLHVVVLDDIGTKVQPNALEPTYIIESSEGNYQWGYVLAEPLDLADAAALMARLKLVPGLSDTKVLEPSHLVRLPRGINGKTSPHGGEVSQYEVALRHFRAELTYTPEQLITAWNAPSVGEVHLPSVREGELDVADVAEHPVLQYFDVLSVENGKAHVVCPNAEEHSSNTGEKETSLLFDEAGGHQFHCFHESCEDFDIDMWLVSQLDMPTPVDEGEEVGIAELTGVPAQDSQRSDTRWLLNNVVVLDEGGFYVMDQHRFMKSARQVDMAFGQLDLPNPGDPESQWAPTRVLQNNDTLEAKGRIWEPGAGAFVGLEGQRYVNTYQREQVPAVDRDDLVAGWLRLARHICGEYTDLVLDHMACTVQRPEVKIRWQVIVFGKPRTGKTMTFSPLIEAMGCNAVTVSAAALQGGWGDSYAGKKAMLVEEVFDYNKSMFNMLKPKLANNDVEPLNMKMQGVLWQRNAYAMYMLTNHNDAVRMDADEDKLLVIKGPDKALDRSLYDQIGSDPDLPAAVYGYLMGRDISGFQHGALPVRTDALHEMVEAALPDYEQAIRDMYSHGEYPFVDGRVMLEPLRDELRQRGYSHNRKGVARALTKLGLVPVQGVKKVTGKVTKVRGWVTGKQAEELSSSEIFSLFNPDMPVR